MRRTRLLGAAVLVTVLMLVGTSPATAAAVAIRASADVAFDQPAALCDPEVLVIEGSGPGTLRLGAFDGDVWVEMSQCTGFLKGGPFDPDAPTVTVGKVTDGFLTLTATSDDSDMLVLAYEGGFVQNSAGTVGYGRWEVSDSGGIFEGASGHGVMHLFGEEFSLHVDVMGSVVVP